MVDDTIHSFAPSSSAPRPLKHDRDYYAKFTVDMDRTSIRGTHVNDLCYIVDVDTGTPYSEKFALVSYDNGPHSASEIVYFYGRCMRTRGIPIIHNDLDDPVNHLEECLRYLRIPSKEDTFRHTSHGSDGEDAALVAACDPSHYERSISDLVH